MVDCSQYDLNTMPPDVWRGMTEEQRQSWKTVQHDKGEVAFCCIQCGFPVMMPELTVGGCESCREEG